MNNIKNILFGAGLGLFFMVGILGTSCTKWTQPEAKDYYTPPTQAYKDNLKDYFNSPHKVMFGWFGNWAGEGGSMANSLMGLPDSVDFVSLWLCWGDINEAKQKDLKAFQERGSKAVLCWRAGDIGVNLTPEGEDPNEFWGVPKRPWKKSDEELLIAAAEKYAMAIADTCRKYKTNGFDYDIEDSGSLVNTEFPSVLNAFMRKLRAEFDKDGMMLVADIPAGSGWIYIYRMLEDDVLLSLDYLIWQHYWNASPDSFLENYMRPSHPDIHDQMLRKSIITGDFEEASRKHYFLEQTYWTPSCGVEVAGFGAYHIEYDYPDASAEEAEKYGLQSGVDYPWVRKAIKNLNPQIKK